MRDGATVASMAEVAAPASRVGALLREWRRRRMSQLDLALEAGVSARHVSFVETGRSRPSAEMVLHLADQLDVPLRDRNRLLLAAGHAGVWAARPRGPEMGLVREMLELVLEATSPTRPWWSPPLGWSPATVPWRCSRRAWPTTCSSPR